MTADPYSARVRELFADPRHAGDLEDATVVERSDQGVRLRLSARLDDQQILALRFRAWGCPHVIAACEAFCAAWEGRPTSELPGFDVRQIMRDLSIPVENTGRILVLEDAVRSLGRSICDGAVTQ